MSGDPIAIIAAGGLIGSMLFFGIFVDGNAWDRFCMYGYKHAQRAFKHGHRR